MHRTPSQPDRSAHHRAPERGQSIYRIVLIVGAIIAYSNSFMGQFVFDDIDAIQRNPNLRTLNPIVACTAAPDSPLAGRPVAAYSFALNFALSGDHPWSHHAVNLLIHIAAGLTLFGLVRRAGGLRDQATTDAELFAFCVTLIWLVHPLQTESVTYIVQRTESLAVLFILLTLYGALRSAEPAAARRKWATLAVVSCALGMATKEIVAVAPLLVLLLDRAVLTSTFRAALRQRWPLYASLAGTWMVLAALMVASPRGATATMTGRIAPIDYLFTQGGVILHYLRLVVWPDQLSIDYNDWPIVQGFTSACVPVTIIGLLMGLSAYGLICNRLWGFLGVSFFLVLAPTSSIVPILSEPAADRRMYLPLACVLTLIAAGLRQLGRRLLRNLNNSYQRAIVVIGLAGLTIPLAIGTLQRNALYHDQAALFRDTLAKRPDNDRLMHNLAAILMQAGPDHYEEASHWLLRAEKLKPDHPVIQAHLGLTLMKMGRASEAEPRFRKAIELRPLVPDYHLYLAGFLHNQKRFEDALTEFRAAAELNPRDDRARQMAGAALLALHRPADAVPFLEAAAALRSTDFNTQLWLGDALAQSGRPAEAGAAYRRALAMKPDDAYTRDALRNLNSPASQP